MLRPLLACIAASLTAASAIPAVAVAGTASARIVVEGEAGDESQTFAVRYVAAGAEKNALRVAIGPTDVRVRDAAGVVAGTGCRQLGRRGARCRVRRRDLPRRFQFFVDVAVTARDEDDSVRVFLRRETFFEVRGAAGNDGIVVSGATAIAKGGGGGLYGGSGDDIVLGGAGGELLAGGRGRDVLSGRGGSDSLRGDAGPDVMRGGRGADTLDAAAGDPLDDADLVHGGEGDDDARYFGTSAPVRVDLSDLAPDGRVGETDRLRAIENVSGGGGPNVLVGDDRDNSLSGSWDLMAPDWLDGRGGDDYLAGGEGPNELFGGTGDDELNDATSHASCGPGTDVLSSTEVMPHIDADCERVRVVLGPDVSPQPLDARGDRVWIRFFPLHAGRIRVVVNSLEAHGAVLARGVVRLPSRRRAGDGVQNRAISLTAEGQAQLLAAPSVPVLVSLWPIGWHDLAERFHTVVHAG